MVRLKGWGGDARTPTQFSAQLKQGRKLGCHLAQGEDLERPWFVTSVCPLLGLLLPCSTAYAEVLPVGQAMQGLHRCEDRLSCLLFLLT